MTNSSNCDTRPERRLCAKCIGEEFLRIQVERLGKTGNCDYCANVAPACSIKKISEYVDQAFADHYRRTPASPSSLEYSMMGDSGWFRDGETSADAIANAAIICEEPAEDIRCILEEWNYDHGMAKIGEENPFVPDACYVERDVDDFKYWDNWRLFENSLKTEARFFNATAEETLGDIFEGLLEVSGSSVTPIIVEAGPATSMSSVYRARVFQTESDLEDTLKRPDLHMGPPPASMAKAGRMNAHGISVFYGATDPRVAISEVRPPVGSRVVVGEFTFLRNVNFLDVSALQSMFVEGSVFDSEFLQRLERAKFLAGFSKLISRPVMPTDESLEYLVTQSVADYLASRSTPALDGIVYPSVQDGNRGSNVMLFHKASRVELMDLPKGTETDISTGNRDNDESEVEYTVFETVPPLEEKQQEEDTNKLIGLSAPLSSSPVRVDTHDIRETTLQLKPESLEVHHVSSARYDTDKHSVLRLQIVGSDSPSF